ncbi:MAG: hypothetical protein AB7E70_02010 [Hyphomicrobiaceae bacterium]
MSFSQNAAAARGMTGLASGSWPPERKRKRDPKKITLIVGLSLLSWISTYTGMLELIQANLGTVGLLERVAVGFAVAMLQVMIVWLLDQVFADLHVTTRMLYAVGYLFLTVISVGFGFGFYWKVLESRAEASRSAESAVGQVQAALHGAQTRLDQLHQTLLTLSTLSTTKAKEERDRGTSCPGSRPGDGPRRALRDTDAQRFQFASTFVGQRISTIKADVKAFDADLVKIVSMDKTTFDARSGTRNDFMKQVGRRLDMAVTRFNAFRTDPQLRQIRSDLADRADRATFPDGKGRTFSCPDPQLQSALKGVVRAIDQLPDLAKPKIAAVEGSEAVIEAFRRLTATLFGAMQLKLPPSPEELRALQQRAVQSFQSADKQRQITMDGAGLAKRDYIPLGVAIFVDFCLLLVSIGRPMGGFQRLESRMLEAEESPVIRILSRFHDIHRDDDIRQTFEVFRHVVFNIGGDYYAAVPVDGSIPLNAGPHVRQEALEAQLLGNLFTSFENEGVFKRVLVPLLTTRGIQKRLKLQGSKFADKPAFRVYRFRREKWSKWVLGAMMGAAKRVEAEKSMMSAQDPKGRVEPSLRERTGAGSGTVAAPPREDAHLGPAVAPLAEPWRGSDWRDGDWRGPSGQPASNITRFPSRTPTAPPPFVRSSDPSSRLEPGGPEMPVARPVSDVEARTDMAEVSRRDPVATPKSEPAVSDEVPAPPAANSNTAPDGRRAAPVWSPVAAAAVAASEVQFEPAKVIPWPAGERQDEGEAAHVTNNFYVVTDQLAFAFDRAQGQPMQVEIESAPRLEAEAGVAHDGAAPSAPAPTADLLPPPPAAGSDLRTGRADAQDLEVTDDGEWNSGADIDIEKIATRFSKEGGGKSNVG